MKASLKNLLLSLLLTGLIAMLLLMKPGDGTLIFQKAEKEVTYQMAENTLIGRNKGEKIWELAVERFSMDEGERLVHLAGQISGTIYRDGAERYRFTATAGVYDRRTQNLEISEQIEIITDEEQRITAGGLFYEQRTNRVRLIPPIRAELGKYTLTADQIVIDLDAELLTATGNIVIFSENNQEIRCNQLYYYGDSDTWEIVGAVEIINRFD
ncbi:MAG: hypothetical protein GX058_10135 [Firmicutes bacterium]|nr:hypothetical protein [Bacillota bacterium]